MNAAEKRHVARVVALGCCVCRNLGVFSPAVAHHIKTGNVGIGRKSSHYEVIPLCYPHHDGGEHGTAFHAGPSTWEAKFGRQVDLLAQVIAMLENENA